MNTRDGSWHIRETLEEQSTLEITGERCEHRAAGELLLQKLASGNQGPYCAAGEKQVLGSPGARGKASHTLQTHIPTNALKDEPGGEETENK